MRRKWDDECKWALANNFSSHVRAARSSSLTLQWELAVILILTQAGLWKYVPSSLWLPKRAFRSAMMCPDSADAWNSTVLITNLCQLKKPIKVISHSPSKSRGGETDLSPRHRQPGSLGVSQPDQPHIQLSHHLGNQGHSRASFCRTSQDKPNLTLPTYWVTPPPSCVLASCTGHQLSPGALTLSRWLTLGKLLNILESWFLHSSLTPHFSLGKKKKWSSLWASLWECSGHIVVTQ